MNKIIFFIFSCLIFGLSGCEQKIDTWSGKDVAYVDMEADSTLVSFIYINTDVDTVQVRVQVMGNIPEDQPRYVDVKVKAQLWGPIMKPSKTGIPLKEVIYSVPFRSY